MSATSCASRVTLKRTLDDRWLQDKYQNLSPKGLCPPPQCTIRLAPAESKPWKETGACDSGGASRLHLASVAKLAALRRPARENGSAFGNKGTGISPGLSSTNSRPPSGSGKQDRGSIG
jgi:hypothetical protein